jgi:hypothetical protein
VYLPIGTLNFSFKYTWNYLLPIWFSEKNIGTKNSKNFCAFFFYVYQSSHNHFCVNKNVDFKFVFLFSSLFLSNSLLNPLYLSTKSINCLFHISISHRHNIPFCLFNIHYDFLTREYILNSYQQVFLLDKLEWDQVIFWLLWITLT